MIKSVDYNTVYSFIGIVCFTDTCTNILCYNHCNLCLCIYLKRIQKEYLKCLN